MNEIVQLRTLSTILPTIFLVVAALVLNVLITRLTRQQRTVIGTLKAIDSERGIVTVEVADGVTLQVVSAAITGEFDAEAYGKSAQRALK